MLEQKKTLKTVLDLKVLQEDIKSQYKSKLKNAKTEFDQTVVKAQHSEALRLATENLQKIPEKDLQKAIYTSSFSFLKSFVSPYYKIKNLANKNKFVIKSEIDGICLILLFDKGELIYVYIDLKRLFEKFTISKPNYDDYFWVFNHQLTFRLCNLLPSNLIWEYLPLINEYYKFAEIQPSDINQFEKYFDDSSRYHCFYCFKRLKLKAYFCSSDCHKGFLGTKGKDNQEYFSSFSIHNELISLKKTFDRTIDSCFSEEILEKIDDIDVIWRIPKYGDKVIQNQSYIAETFIEKFLDCISKKKFNCILEAKDIYNPDLAKTTKSWLGDFSALMSFFILQKKYYGFNNVIKIEFEDDKGKFINLKISGREDKEGNLLFTPKIHSITIENISAYTTLMNKALKITQTSQTSISEESIRLSKFKIEEFLPKAINHLTLKEILDIRDKEESAS